MEAVSELETIKWLLTAILIGIALIAISAITIAIIFWLFYKTLNEESSEKIFKFLAEEHLAKNETDKLINHVDKRLSSHPHDVWANWYKGQAKYHLGEYTESKRHFEKVVELEPRWDSTVEPWLAKINKKLEKGPQLVE